MLFIYRFSLHSWYNRILTNGLGIIRHIAFLDDNFKTEHLEINLEKKSDSPDEDKYFYFSKALIPYNSRNESTLKKVGYNEYGYPTCPNDPSLAMKYCSITHEKGRDDRIKWICPKVHMIKGQYICDCDTPCSTATKGRITYTYKNLDFRMFPGIQRDSKEWDSFHKIRTIVERAIDHLKINMCAARRKSRNHTTTKADVFLAGIASQLTIIVAHSMNCPQYIRSLKSLIV